MNEKDKLSNSMILLGKVLIERGVIGAGRWEEILSDAGGSDDALLKYLSAEGAGSEAELMDTLAKELKVPFIELEHYIVDPVLCMIIPAAIALEHTILPLQRGEDFLTLVMADPANAQAIDDVELMTGLKVKPVLARSRDIVKLSAEVLNGGIPGKNPLIDGWYDGDGEK